MIKRYQVNGYKPYIISILKGEVLMGVTIKDVAKEAGVSIATVSYVINNKGNVTVETKEKVLKAVKSLGYQPNLSARNLVGQKSNLIGVLIPDWGNNDEAVKSAKDNFNFDNPFYGNILNSIESTSTKAGYSILLIASTITADKIKSIILQRDLDGLIIIGALPKLLNSLAKVKVPVVLIDSYTYNDDFYKIGIDDEYGGYIATKHLLDLGHKEIALISGELIEDGVDMERFKGYQKALLERNIPIKEENICNVGVSMEGGYQGVEELLNQNYDITGIFSTADIMSIGIYKKLNELKLNIPEDISVVSFDNFPYTEFLHPSLSTVSQPVFLKGRRATELLISLIAGKRVDDHSLTLSIELIERDSVKNLK